MKNNIFLKPTYPLLEKAPKQHLTKEFVDFLRDNNVVIKETETWLLIENVKYHIPEKPHYTLFRKKDGFIHDLESMIGMQEFLEEYRDWEWLKHRPSEQTIRKFHIHLIK